MNKNKIWLLALSALMMSACGTSPNMNFLASESQSSPTGLIEQRSQKQPDIEAEYPYS
ncbi:hypothetical protein [Deinococcus sp. SL84]|uniref:hypothetical protein n=1 Tax=Deinococcus sp. SL84 TaxID=2994663 RepID=UPI002273E149|nr:hypothetical protein [Deinococcus sp. SL84]MCY1703739.1 hypothetical protein [Deinococcus sp. SL84]